MLYPGRALIQSLGPGPSHMSQPVAQSAQEKSPFGAIFGILPRAHFMHLSFYP
jgi:hypothetical protein